MASKTESTGMISSRLWRHEDGYRAELKAMRDRIGSDDAFPDRVVADFCGLQRQIEDAMEKINSVIGDINNREA